MDPRLRELDGYHSRAEMFESYLPSQLPLPMAAQKRLMQEVLGDVRALHRQTSGCGASLISQVGQ